MNLKSRLAKLEQAFADRHATERHLPSVELTNDTRLIRIHAIFERAKKDPTEDNIRAAKEIARLLLPGFLRAVGVPNASPLLG